MHFSPVVLDGIKDIVLIRYTMDLYTHTSIYLYTHTSIYLYTYTHIHLYSYSYTHIHLSIYLYTQIKSTYPPVVLDGILEVPLYYRLLHIPVYIDIYILFTIPIFIFSWYVYINNICCNLL